MASITSERAGPQVARRACDALLSVLPGQRPVALHEPDMGATECETAAAVVRSGWISTAGRHVDRFERQLAEYTGIPHAIATVNGTAALHTCLVMAGVRADEEVIAPALTFVGTINPICYQSAIPHFVDCEAATLGIDPPALEEHLQQVAERRGGMCVNRLTGRRIRALIVVHVLGVPARIGELLELAKRWHLTLIEDAAEALGSWRDNAHCGSHGLLSALSFNGNKIISTGGGGAVLTADPALAAQARHLTTTAKSAHPWEFQHDRVGFNYRMPNINAALGCAQLARLDDFLERKRQLQRRYLQAFSALDEVTLFTPPTDVNPNHWLNLLLLPDRRTRDQLLHMLHEQQVGVRPFWNPMHQLPMFRDAPRSDLGTSELLWERGVCLPSSPRLTHPVQ